MFGLLTINYDYLDELFEDVEIEYLHTRLMALIEDAIKNEDVSVEDIRIMSMAEENKILNEFNDTYMTYPKDKTVIELFEEQASKTPDNIALVFESQSLTYKELNEKANSLAHYLKEEKKVKRNDNILILMNRCKEIIISILACQKLGLAYIPMDANYPKERIEYITQNSKAKLIIKNIEYNSKIETLDIEDCDFSGNYNNINFKYSLDDLAYIIYTSGSTGKPKGVMITNKNLLNFLYGINRDIKIDSKNRIVSVTTISFDIFGLELWLPLINGATIVLANENEQIDYEELNRLCINNNVDIIQTTPTKLKLLTNENNDNDYIKRMKKILLGGENVPQTLIEKLQKTTDAEIFDVYGPTETTIWSSVKKINKNERVSAGKPIQNTKIYVFDKKNRILPLNSVGQLTISGDSVSLRIL